MPTERRNRLFAASCLVALVSVSTAACARDAEDSAEEQNPLIATINGQALPLDLFRLFYLERLREEQAENDQAFQERAFNEFVNLVVLAQEGERRELDQREEVRNAIELQRLGILARAAQQSMVSDDPATEAELKEAYDQFVGEAQRTEYKARHILVGDEPEAKQLIKQLDKGASFADLAKKHSLGPTGKSGGELDWFHPDQMVKPFAEAVQQLEPKAYTTEPVHTQFGWHVILLEETRKAEPSSFEDAKPELAAAVQRRKLAEEVAQLRQGATVTLNTDIVKLKEGQHE